MGTGDGAAGRSQSARRYRAGTATGDTPGGAGRPADPGPGAVPRARGRGADPGAGADARWAARGFLDLRGRARSVGLDGPAAATAPNGRAAGADGPGSGPRC